MHNNFKQIIYSSEARVDMDELTLQSILELARMRNAQYGITGMLLFINNHFLQVLEGEPTSVEVLYANIVKDRRHRNVRTLMNRRIADREFSNSSMAHRALTVDEVRIHPELNDFLSPSFDAQKFRESASPARFMALLHKSKGRGLLAEQA